MIPNTKAFTLVELIVVVIILSILLGVWFNSYVWNLVSVRDTTRIATLERIWGAFWVALTKWKLPYPDDDIQILSSGSLVWYQWYAWSAVLQSISYLDGWQDPKDEVHYSYYLSANRKYFQLLAFLEDGTIQTRKNGSVYADNLDYSLRYPYVSGNKLGILTGTWVNLNTPVQEISALQSAGQLDIGTTTDNYVAYISASEIITWDSSQLRSSVYNSSCKRILQSWASNWDGVYKIIPNPWAQGIQVYCDMSNDLGWWMLIATKANDTNHSDWQNSTGTLLTNPIINVDNRISREDYVALFSSGSIIRIEINDYLTDAYIRPSGDSGSFYDSQIQDSYGSAFDMACDYEDSYFSRTWLVDHVFHMDTVCSDMASFSWLTRWTFWPGAGDGVSSHGKRGRLWMR